MAFPSQPMNAGPGQPPAPPTGQAPPPPSPPSPAPLAAPAAAPAVSAALPGQAPATAAPPMPVMAPQAPMSAAPPVPGQPMVHPAAAPAAGADPTTELLTQLNARLQAIEATLAKLAQDPGNAPEEVEQRRQASDYDNQSNDQKKQAQQHQEQAAAFRAQIAAAESDHTVGCAGGDDVSLADAKKPVVENTKDQGEPKTAPGGHDVSLADAKKPVVENLRASAAWHEQQRDACYQQAYAFSAQAAVLRAKAYGVFPILQATSQLITDSTAQVGKLVTDLGAKIDALPTKLLTDKTGEVAPGQGGKRETPSGAGENKSKSNSIAAQQADAAAPPPAPARRTLTAAGEDRPATLDDAAAHFVSKFGDVTAENQRVGFTTDGLSAAAEAAHLSPQQRMAMQIQLAAQGLLRK
jgi:hypothetical protein